MDKDHSLSPNMEDYLETIYRLSQKHGVARPKEIAKELQVHKASVTSAIKNLKENGYITHEPYELIHITEEGENLAKKIFKKHSILKNFLVRILNVSPEIAEHDACQMEHVIHQETLQQFVRFIELIESSPNLIKECLAKFQDDPDYPMYNESNGSVSHPFGEALEKDSQVEYITLDQLKPGDMGIVSKISLKEEFRQKLMDLGIIPGSEIAMKRLAPFGDPIELVVRGYHLSIRKREAKGILVKIAPQ